MSEYKVLVTDKASLDMENIYNYIAEDSGYGDIAMQQYDLIAASILSLNEFPGRIRIMDSEPEHSLAVRKLCLEDYYILFQIRDMSVVVLRVLHCKEDIENKLFR